ncbi:MAG TPA: hypothetical protein VIV58_23405 [Kofleriaceae bacterium]
MSGVPWDAQLANRIAEILASAGHKIPEPQTPHAPAICPHCQRTDELSIRETYIALHPYDAARHEAEVDDPDEGEGDYTAYCSSCGTKGDLASFGIPANFTWSDHD